MAIRRKTVQFNTQKGPVSFKATPRPKSTTKAAKTAKRGR